MTGSPVKTAKRLTKLMLLLDCVREAVIAEMPDRNMDMYDLVEPLPEGCAVGRQWFAMRHAAEDCHRAAISLTERAVADLGEDRLRKRSPIEQSGALSLDRFELFWTEERARPSTQHFLAHP